MTRYVSTRQLLILCVGFLHITTNHGVAAFVPPPIATFTAPSTASSSSTTALAALQPRRQILKGLKRLLLGGIAWKTASGLTPQDAAVAAQAPTQGRTVEVELHNLDGTRGRRSGTVRIQLRPEWAPRGVARFEVRTSEREKSRVCLLKCLVCCMYSRNHKKPATFSPMNYRHSL